ncbi:MAG TPA: nucleotidyl transferase AbiEii/AbiGii toxin family protein [Rhabdochlamydiaceae bacterium]|nr:nucleotidyl transferase AbiEii/AbiGii toxin family protein [Rhabdochlamydiaceae bacterium]
MIKAQEEMEKPLGDSIRQKLKDLSIEKNRPFEEILRYYGIERFLYRLSISPHAKKFFLKGGLMLKVWDAEDHRATMDIDLLAWTSNKIENLKQIINEVALIRLEEDAIIFNCQNLILRRAQTGGEYEGVSASFSAILARAHIPILVDIGFNDLVVPEPRMIHYPTLLPLPAPKLLGYTPETVLAEKLESIIKLGLINTRMKDFYDIWTLYRSHKLNSATLKLAIEKVFSNRKTKLEYPISFSKAFYEAPATQQRWHNFLSVMGKDPIALQDVILEISNFIEPLLETQKL